ncbi:ABC transporter ATPase [Sphingobacterium sp. DK4209]|uniref:ABC transporter ATPase n=1 Tax=Sphingobacterium zhuxiongii TaxID=2662364 RepID=A0A5Q0QDG0_9SPHI|nr:MULTISPECIES: ABC transporter ATPase [unclassified Sphingobacterium]MVZ64877.1 ABC transporter ATPase [Sphingobacterium sp. DK4209]QGA25220.1 ABC transporter ATPase [Sphingobacterium sp. dk4302]
MKKIWIYQANRFFTQPELELAQAELKDFVAEWTAHGSQLAGTAEIKYNLFVILTVDEALAQTTGCSIDKSVHLLKKIESDLQIDLFNRMLISYRDIDGHIQLVSRDVFEALYKEGVIKEDTIVFNNLIQQAEELSSKWEIPFKDSWHATVFKK